VTVHHLPGTKLSPEVVLHRTLQKIEDIQSVIVLIAWKDDPDRTWSADWSLMKKSDFAAAAMVLHWFVMQELGQGYEEDGR